MDEGETVQEEKAVEKLPPQFEKWMDDNGERIARAKSVPYFFKENIGTMSGEYLKKACKEVRQTAMVVDGEVQGMAEKTAHLYRVDCTPINYKSYDSIMRKVLAERSHGNEAFSPDMLKDVVRTTIICDNGKIEDVLKSLISEGIEMSLNK